MPVRRDIQTCPFCGFQFEKQDTACHHGCPLATRCDLVRCPACAMEFPARPRPFSWLAAFFRRRPASCALPRDGSLLLTQLPAGARARLVRIEGPRENRRKTLAVYGFTTGCEITLLQQRPAVVIRVDQTEIALDEEIAREIIVKPIAELPADGQSKASVH
jgi:Fe2+ transport system protein FeoA